MFDKIVDQIHVLDKSLDVIYNNSSHMDLKFISM